MAEKFDPPQAAAPRPTETDEAAPSARAAERAVSPPAMLRLYHGFGRVGGPALARWLLRRRLARGKEDPARIGERFGAATLERPAGPLLWLHAASVGESVSLLPLVAAALEARPDVTILVTTGTRTSAALMAERLPLGALHQFAPIDTAGSVRRFLEHWRPDAFGLIESELWPTLLRETRAFGARMALLSARLSKRSARRWGRAPRSAATLLSYFDVILAQDDLVAERLRNLGAHPERLSAPGALKQTAAPLPVDPDALARLRASCGERPIWLAASTHEGEDDAAMAAHRHLAARWPRLLTLIAPRHPERGASIAAKAAAAGLRAERRSRDGPINPETQIYIADTLGEMGLWHMLAPIAFVGGSLTPVGGHNPLEAARFGSAVIMGPERENVLGECARLEAQDALATIAAPEALAAALEPLFSADGAPSAEARRRGEAARRAATGDAAILSRYVAALAALLPPPPAAEEARERSAGG